MPFATTPASSYSQAPNDHADGGEVHLASLVARRRQLADHISMAQTELEHLDGEITSQRRTLAARQLYKPALASRERCLQLASLVLGHLQPREFQIVAACALHEERDVFVVQRAGLGKSMCFILAGLMGPSPPSSLPSGQHATLTVYVFVYRRLTTLDLYINVTLFASRLHIY
jgi:hypothetical protein